MNIQKSINQIVRERESKRRKYERVRKVLVLVTTLFLGIFIGSFFLQDNFSITGYVASGVLPTVGGDSGNWGTILNDYLSQEHTEEGGHKNVTVEGNLNVSENINLTGNLTLGDKITFRLGEIIDNLVDGFITITGSLNVSNILVLNPQLSPATNVEGGLFYNSSLNALMAYNGTEWLGLTGVPQGAMVWFDGSCPIGFSAETDADGRYIVSNSTGTQGAVVGIALSDLEDRTHAHPLSAAGGAEVFASTSGYRFKESRGPDFLSDLLRAETVTSTAETTRASAALLGNTDNNSVTDAPYIQYTLCKKVGQDFTETTASLFGNLNFDTFLINISHRFGIGTTSPTEMLHVVGNALFTGNLNVTGNLTVEGVTNFNSWEQVKATGDVSATASCSSSKTVLFGWTLHLTDDGQMDKTAFNSCVTGDTSCSVTGPDTAGNDEVRVWIVCQ